MSIYEEWADAAIAYAKAQLGDPYVFGAQPPDSWDCSKLTTWAWSKATGGQGYSGGKVQLYPYTYTQVSQCDKLPNVSPSNGSNGLQKGDLLFYFKNGAHHVTMYIGGGEIIEASSPETDLRITPLWTSWNTTHFTSAGRPKGVKAFEDTTGTGGNGGGGRENNSNQRAVVSTRSVKKSAVALSNVYGTPQTARFAALNLANETVWLGSEKSGVINGADAGLLQIVAKAIIPGDQYEIKKTIEGGKNSFEIIIESDAIQSADQAYAIASIMSRSFSYQYKAIEVSIFGNPLVQIGDIVKFNYYSAKVVSSSTDFYVVTRVNHNFDNGLSTTLTLKPLIQTTAVV